MDGYYTVKVEITIWEVFTYIYKWFLYIYIITGSIMVNFDYT